MSAQQPSVFKEGIPNWLIITALVICNIPALFILGLYNTNITYTSSFLGVEAEDMQFLITISYGALLATFLLDNRLFRFFTTRNYLLVNNILTIGVLYAASMVHNYNALLILRIFMGILVSIESVSFIPLLLSRFKSKSGKIITYSIFYALLLSSTTLTQHLGTWILDRYGWPELMYAVMAAHLFVLFILLTLFKSSDRHTRKYPLHQVDLVSFVLMFPMVYSGAYILIYGRKLYWFESQKIWLSLIIFLIASGLFILKQLSTKRPYYRFDVLKSANVRIGVFLFICFYVFRAALNSLYSTMSQVWHWELDYIVHVQYLNVLGIIIGVILSAILLARNFPPKYLFATGFFLLAVQFAWFTTMFNFDVSMHQLAMPLIVQGTGVGMLFTPMVLFIVSSVTPDLSLHASFTGVTTRFWSTNLGFALMQNAQYYFQQKHYTWLERFVSTDFYTATDRLAATTQNFISKGFAENEAQRLALKSVDSAVHTQTILLSNMELYTILAICAFVLTILILVNQHLRKSVNQFFRNRLSY